MFKSVDLISEVFKIYKTSIISAILKAKKIWQAALAVIAKDIITNLMDLSKIN